MRTTIVLCVSLLVVDVAAQRPGVPGGIQGPLPGGRMQRPPRDPRDVPTGTAVIRGRIVAADTGSPIRKVQVRAMAPELRESRMASTDAQGRFELKDLPAGRWDVSATKAGFVTLRYGQRRPFESGRPIELGDGETMARADFVLPRGGVITGRIADEFGDPVASARVVVQRYQTFQGTKRLVPTGMGDETDDTGAYRVYGLAPGDYYVSATLRSNMFADDSSDTTSYAPTYFPGTGNMAEAQRVTLNLGQELASISFALQPTKAVRVTGTARDSKGEPLSNGFVMLHESMEGSTASMMMMRQGGRVRADGTFTVVNVSPGNYTLTVNAGGMAGPDAEGATASITVGNEDLTGINLVTSKGTTMTGTIVLAPGATGKLTMQGIQVFPQSPRFEPMFGMGPGRVDSDGTFRVTGLRGRRLFRLMNVPPTWSLKAVMLNGQDIIDTPIEFKDDDDLSGLQMVVTDRVSEVNGRVTGDRGEPTRDYTVVIFPEDSAKWTYPSRYVRAGRADQEGMFKIRDFPPDSRYLAVAVDYLEEGEGGDPQFLEQIRDRATEISIGEGEVKALNLKLVKR
jgi:hypothetical protein